MRESVGVQSGSVTVSDQELQDLRKELEDLRAELKVRTEIMNVTSIVSEADLKGDIVTINEKFIEVSKYSKEELIGQPHSTTRHPDMPKETFKTLWSTIGRGKMFRGVIKNRAKDGTPYYVDAVIAPILGANGKPRKYLGVRYDITESELERQNAKGLLDAINKSSAMIEFDTKGNILGANDGFLKTMGYSLDEIKGKHHRMFVEPDQVQSAQYHQFWDKLQRGEYDAGEYKRLGKGGREVWLQASYNPILDEMGRPFKVVKLAADTTAARVAADDLRRKVDLLLKAVAAGANGDLTTRIEVHGSDAIGQMGEGLETLFTSLRTSVSTIAGSAEALAEASHSLAAMSQQMSSEAEETSAQATVVASASEQISRSIQTVSAGSEEMNASIREIAKNATEAARVATHGVTVAETTNRTVAKLGVSSAEIGKVIKVITSIAQQTNLLALNATIEAARAGEAGKGFAVVANEVKELAKETAKATEDISQKIDTIQTDATGAVEAIREIGQIIRDINNFQGTIATAVEEQTATTNEIGRNVSEAAKGSAEIAQNITSVAQAAKSTTQGASEALQKVSQLSSMASDLRSVVAQFVYDEAVPPAGGREVRRPQRAGAPQPARS